jgi:hypothetical protein
VASLDAAILQVGNERGILVADTGLALNGPNHDEDPYDKGYLADGVHENNVGAQVVADVFRKLGYEPIVPLVNWGLGGTDKDEEGGYNESQDMVIPGD